MKLLLFYDGFSSSEELTFSKTIVTKREKEIIQLITQELTVDEIAEQLFLSRYTVETHKKNKCWTSKKSNSVRLYFLVPLQKIFYSRRQMVHKQF